MINPTGMQFLPGESTGMRGRVYLVSNPTLQLNTDDLKFTLFTFITPNPRIRNVGKLIRNSKNNNALVVDFIQFALTKR